MSKPIVDAKGKTCPVPLVMTKKVFDPLAEGDQMQVLVDNDTSAKNVETFVQESGGQVKLEKEGSVTTLTITKGVQAESGQAESYCSTTAPHVIYVSTNRVGVDGEEDFGKALMQTFLQTIKDVTPRPSHLLFMHRGVQLLKKGTKTAEAVAELEQQGISVIVCGTCLDYYNLMDERACGKVSNMYDILSILSQAGKVIKP